MLATNKDIAKGEVLASFYFFIQGLGSLLPYATTLSTLDFYTDKFPTGHSSFTFPIAMFTSNAIFILFMVTVKRNFTLNCRIPFCLSVVIILLFAMPILAILFAGTQLGIWLVLICLFTCGGFSIITNATVVGLAGHFPSDCMTKNSTGASVAGLLSNLLRAIFLIFFPYNSSEGSKLIGILVYYGSSILILLLCIFLHFKFIHSDFAAIYLPPENLPASKRPVGSSPDATLYVVLDEENQGVVVGKNTWKRPKGNFEELWRVFKIVKFLFILMAVNSFQTTNLTPGVMLKRPFDNLDPAWKIIIVLAVYNLFDALGKMVTFIRHTLRPSLLVGLVIFRFLFYFTFIMEATTLRYAIIDADWFAFLNIALFAFIGGYVTACLFILCPDSVTSGDKEVAGFLALLSLLGGMAMGTIGAYPFRNLSPK